MTFGNVIEFVLTVVLFIAATSIKIYLDYTDPRDREPSR